MDKAIKKWWPLFVLPTMAAFAIGFLIPFIWGFYLSFCEFTTIQNATWVGFENYVRAFTDPSSIFMHSLWYTALYAVLSTVVVNVLGLAVALVLVRGIRGSNLFRTVFFMPNLIGGIVLGWLWQVLINGVLARYGVTIVTNEWYGFWSLMIVTIWQQVGYMMIIYISGLQTIPQGLLEAAAIDGATGWQTLRYVKIPMVMPCVTICTFLSISNGFKMFDQNMVLTGGVPPESQLMALDIYDTFYGRTGWAGAGQAKAVVFCLIVVGIALLQQRLTREREVQR